MTDSTNSDTLGELSTALAAAFAEPGTSGIFCKANRDFDPEQPIPEKKQDSSAGNTEILQNDLAENTLFRLVRTGMENDFEQVVFPIHTSLRAIKRQLMGIDPEDPDLASPDRDVPGAKQQAESSPALYAALSGSGSTLFGLYRSMADAQAAQQRVQAAGCKAVTTHTLPRAAYWRTMFAG